MGMIIGHGDLASVLSDREDVTFFASGVSNSGETRVSEYEREKNLLLGQERGRHIVYFSSLCIYYSQSMYANHKIVMEQVVKNNFPGYTIIRIGNITWGKNPNTLINYLRAHPEAEIQNVYRHLITKEEFLYWMNLIPVSGKNEMNIPGEMVFVPDLMNQIKSELQFQYDGKLMGYGRS